MKDHDMYLTPALALASFKKAMRPENGRDLRSGQVIPFRKAAPPPRPQQPRPPIQQPLRPAAITAPNFGDLLTSKFHAYK